MPKLTYSFVLYLRQSLTKMARKIVKEVLVLALLFEELPQRAWLLEVFFCHFRRIRLDSADPFIVRHIGWARSDLAEGRANFCRISDESYTGGAESAYRSQDQNRSYHPVS